MLAVELLYASSRSVEVSWRTLYSGSDAGECWQSRLLYAGGRCTLVVAVLWRLRCYMQSCCSMLAVNIL